MYGDIGQTLPDWCCHTLGSLVSRKKFGTYDWLLH